MKGYTEIHILGKFVQIRILFGAYYKKLYIFFFKRQPPFCSVDSDCFYFLNNCRNKMVFLNKKLINIG